MFKGQAAKAAAQQEAAAAAAGDEGELDAVLRLSKDMEDLIAAAQADQTNTAAAAGPQRGRARVMVEDDDDQTAGASTAVGQGEAAQPAQVDHTGNTPQQARDQQQQQQRGKENKQQRQPAPDRSSDYKAWVAYQKQQWKAGRHERKRRKTEAANRRSAVELDGPQVKGHEGHEGSLGVRLRRTTAVLQLLLQQHTQCVLIAQLAC